MEILLYPDSAKFLLVATLEYTLGDYYENESVDACNYSGSFTAEFNIFVG